MLDTETKRRIDTARDILVGKVPDPKSQVEQITIALIYKFMDDMDADAEELGGARKFFAGDFARYGWAKLMRGGLGGHETLNLYAEAVAKMPENPGVPALFRDIFKNAYLPYRDPETLRAFLKVIDEFSYDHSERLGDAFEYLLSVLGSQGDAGQFRTPRHIIDFIVAVVDPKKHERVLDPACGTAGFLISAYKHILRANTDADGHSTLTPDDRGRLAENFVGYDISPDMVRLSLANLYLHDFTNPHVDEYDTLTSDERWSEHADVILANPPFMSPKGGIKPHNRFSVQSKRSEVLFVDYIAEHLTPGGRAGVIVPEGVIFQSQTAYVQLRKMLVEESLVAVVSLPAGVFNPYSGVKTSILLLDRSLARQAEHVAFFKVENDGFGLGAQRRQIAGSQLDEVRRELAEYFRLVRAQIPTVQFHSMLGTLVPKAKLAANADYNLSGERYREPSLATASFPLVPLGAVCTINPPKKDVLALSPETVVSFVPMSALGENRIDFVPEETKRISEVGASYTYFADGDVLLAKVTPCFENGKAGVAKHLMNGLGFGSSEFFVLRPSAETVAEYVYFCVTHRNFRQAAIAQMTGTGGLQRVPRAYVEEFRIPLPPREVQQEIVAEIDGYQRIVDGARVVVDSYRPRIAVRSDWPTVELATLCEINPKKGEIGDWDGDTEVSFVPMADLGEHSMLFQPIHSRRLREATTGYSYFRDGDVLLAKVTPCFENGKAGIARGLRNGVGFGSSEFFVLRPFANTLPEWLYMNVMTERFRAKAANQMTGTGGLQRVPRSVLESFEIPLPPLSVQAAIVADVAAEQALVDANRELVTRFERKIEATLARIWGDHEPPAEEP